ncbi:hypothetical protein Y032_0561g3484 [Ancylostoma ceylanicum]|uniref:Uncharacterized protein n=1 Tax=Ancylostoma ceylanicum TaxID=53326 RepID=A0A016WQV9_9BILA|nr:hypothetical protein Y032_0561g3484 [Ancylostoma ceylanicum]
MDLHGKHKIPRNCLSGRLRVPRPFNFQTSSRPEWGESAYRILRSCGLPMLTVEEWKDFATDLAADAVTQAISSDPNTAPVTTQA